MIKRTSFIRTSFALTSFALTPFVHAATYYVAKNTTGTACSQSSPCGTIAAGIARMSGGDTLLIGDGIYVEGINDTIPSGSFGAPTIIQASNRNGAIMRPTSAWSAFQIYTRSYITIDGIDADMVNVPDGQPYYIVAPAHHITIQNGTARNGTGVFGQGIELKGASDNQVLDMDSFDNGWTFGAVGTPVATPAAHGVYVSGPRNVIAGNRFRNNGVYGIQIYNAVMGATDDNVVKNNIVESNPKGIVIAGGNNTQVYNNVIYGNGFGIVVNYAVSNALIYNNTISGNASYCIDLAQGSGHKVTNNICYGNGSDVILQSGGSGTINSNLSSNPNFTDPSNANFHLTANSIAAIDRGIDLSAVFDTDKDANTRPADAWDMGAYEYGGTSSASRCDLNASGATDALDLQSLVNAILVGSNAQTNDLNRDGNVNVQDAQVMVNVILGTGTCP